VNSPRRRCSFPRLVLIGLLLFGAERVHAQGDGNPWALLKPALAKLSHASESKTRFTFFDLNHLQNFDEKGKKFVDMSQLFEVTYIGNLQYSRLVEMNGKPLSGKDLKKEQERYDEAVREHSALDDAARAKIQHQEMKRFDVNLNDLSKDYRSSIVGRADVNGTDCVLIDAAPLSSVAQRHFRIWVDPLKERMMRIETTMLADEDDKLSGSKLSQTWMFIDDNPLVSENHFDTRILVGKKQVHVVSNHEYTRFRKFSVTATVVPVEPDGNP
jgi:hypothetical protein